MKHYPLLLFFLGIVPLNLQPAKIIHTSKDIPADELLQEGLSNHHLGKIHRALRKNANLAKRTHTYLKSYHERTGKICLLRNLNALEYAIHGCPPHIIALIAEHSSAHGILVASKYANEKIREILTAALTKKSQRLHE
jgi:hypothetical protein